MNQFISHSEVKLRIVAFQQCELDIQIIWADDWAETDRKEASLSTASISWLEKKQKTKTLES